MDEDSFLRLLNFVEKDMRIRRRTSAYIPERNTLSLIIYLIDYDIR